LDGRKPLVFISAAEPSADLHGAALIRATLRLCPDTRFVGVAGPKMAAAGCDRIYDFSQHSAMLLGAIGAAGRAISMLTTCENHLRRYPFDAAVVIDSPTLHLPLAAKAHAIGVPVLYYIAPQMWAWGAYRIHKLRNNADRVAVILPFEEEYFRSQGVDATYVGHPLAEGHESGMIAAGGIDGIRSCDRPVVALLPGSREHVVREVLSGQMRVAEAIAAELPNATFGVSVANRQVEREINNVAAASTVPVGLWPDNNAALIRAASLALVASGTATLDVALHGTPMIVMYNASRLFYQLVGRWMVRVPYLSLPNILAGREIVPEYMPYYRSTAPIAKHAIELLRSEEALRKMRADLAEMVEPLRRPRASERTAEMLIELATHG